MRVSGLDVSGLEVRGRATTLRWGRAAIGVRLDFWPALLAGLFAVHGLTASRRNT